MPDKNISDARRRYLQKIRGIENPEAESVKKELFSTNRDLLISIYNGEDINLDSIPINQNKDTKYTNTYNNDTNYTNQVTQKIAATKSKGYYPSFTAAQISQFKNIQNEYAQNARETYDSFEIDTESYIKNGKAYTPSGRRTVYSATVTKYIEEQGGVQNSSLFVPFDTNEGRKRFDDRICKRSINPYSTYVRKDLLYYLNILHDKVINNPAFGSTKLMITSAYRCPFYQYEIYRGKAKTNYWSAHMGGYAVDIATSSSYKKAKIIADAAYRIGFGGIAIGKVRGYFVHLDLGPYGRWKYSGVPKYIEP